MKIPKLEIGSVIADVPIIQGGMGVKVSLSSLAAAVAETVRRIGRRRPRHLLTAERLEAFRQACQVGELRDEWSLLRRHAEARLAEDFTMVEPPFLPEETADGAGG